MVLHELSLDIGPAVAGLGVVGIAVGFGAQSLVRDYFNGALILSRTSSARATSWRSPASPAWSRTSPAADTLRDLDGVVHTVPNGEIKVASNRTRVWARINQDVTVAYGTDIDRATAVVDEVGQAIAEDPVWRQRILEPPRVERVEALGEYGVTLKVLGTVAGVGAVGGQRRAAQAPPRGVRAERHRDPASAARRAREGRRPRPVPGRRSDRPGTDRRRPGRRHSTDRGCPVLDRCARV